MSVLAAAQVPSKERKKIMILAGLGIVLAVVVLIRVLFPGGTEGATSTAQASQSGQGQGELGPLDADPAYLATVAKIARVRLGKAYEPETGRDPMEPLARERATRPSTEGREPEPVPVAPPVHTLYGIVWDPDRPIAMIDGQDVRVGDSIKGAKVIEIGIDRVVLSYRSRQFVLTVE